MPLVECHDGAELGVGPHERAPLDPAQAREVLRMLIALRAKGLRRPLPFAPYSGWELYRAPSFERGVQLAAQRWHGSERSWGEGTGEALRVDRKRVGEGKSVSVRVELGGRRMIKKKKRKHNEKHEEH